MRLSSTDSTTPARMPAEALQIDRGLRRKSIMESLIVDVFHGRLRAGQHLVTQELADRFGVSHTPIREALIALDGMGIVDCLPNRGAMVRQVSTRDVAEICDVRRVLECEATRAACGRVDLARLHELQHDLRRLTTVRQSGVKRFIAQAREIDNRLHDLISSSSGNAFLANEINRLKLLFRVFRDVSWEHEEARNDGRRLTGEAAEHLAIVDGLLAGDAKGAARAMSRHIRSGARYWSRSIPDPMPVPTAPNRSNGRRPRLSREV